MFGKRIKLFKLLGFEVNIDLSWIIIAVLITWSLAAGLFPYLYPSLERETYWIMGVVGALGLFISIVAHEFCHSLVARKFGMHMKGITLFIFGGVAEMGEEPPTAKAEFCHGHCAGPCPVSSSAGIFYLIYRGGVSGGWDTPGQRGHLLSRLHQRHPGGLQSPAGLSPGWRAGAALHPLGRQGQPALGHPDLLHHRLRLRPRSHFPGRLPVYLWQRHRRGVDVSHRHVFAERRPDVLPAALGAQGPGGRDRCAGS